MFPVLGSLLDYLSRFLKFSEAKLIECIMCRLAWLDKSKLYMLLCGEDQHCPASEIRPVAQTIGGGSLLGSFNWSGKLETCWPVIDRETSRPTTFRDRSSTILSTLKCLPLLD